MKIEIVATGPLPAGTLQGLEAAYTVHRLWEAVDRAAFLAPLGGRIRGLVTSAFCGADAALMDALPKTEIISNFGVGYDSVDVGAARARGIPVTNTPDVLTEDVADLALGLILDTSRQISLMDRFVRSGQWPHQRFALGRSITGKRCGIVGMGRIGQAIARRVLACGMTVSWHGPRPKPDLAYAYEPDLKKLAQEADFLVVICPLSRETHHLINAEILDALGPTGVLINVARGPVVDEQALVAALTQKIIAGAGLDVFEHEPHVPEILFSCDTVVLQPHAGSATVETRAAMGQLVIDNLAAHFGGRPLLTPV